MLPVTKFKVWLTSTWCYVMRLLVACLRMRILLIVLERERENHASVIESVVDANGQESRQQYSTWGWEIFNYHKQ